MAGSVPTSRHRSALAPEPDSEPGPAGAGPWDSRLAGQLVLIASGLALLVAGSDALPVPPDLLRFDLWVMLAAMVACLPILVSGRMVGRWEGLVLLAYYVGYTIYLVMVQQKEAGTGMYADAVLHIVAPLTALWLVAQMLPRRVS